MQTVMNDLTALKTGAGETGKVLCALEERVRALAAEQAKMKSELRRGGLVRGGFGLDHRGDTDALRSGGFGGWARWTAALALAAGAGRARGGGAGEKLLIDFDFVRRDESRRVATKSAVFIAGLFSYTRHEALAPYAPYARKVYNLSAALVAARSLVLRSIASRITFATTLHPSMASAWVGSNTSTEHLLSDCVKTTLSTLTSLAT